MDRDSNNRELEIDPQRIQRSIQQPMYYQELKDVQKQSKFEQQTNQERYLNNDFGFS